MRCCADVVRAILLGVVFTLQGAGGVTAQRASLPDRVAAEIAQRWGIDATDVVLQWSSPDAAAALPSDAPLRLRGGGQDGVWYVDVETEAGDERLRVRAGVETTRKIAARDLDRGVTLVADDIGTEQTVRWGPPPRNEETVEPGWVTRRRIIAGQPLVAPAVARPLAIRPGDDVQIVYASGPVELVLTGRAAGSAAIGERIAVRAETGKRLEGVVVADGTVRIDNGASRR